MTAQENNQSAAAQQPAAVQKEAERQQKEAAKANAEIKKATEPSNTEKAQSLLQKGKATLGKKLTQAAHAVEQKYEDLTWHSDDWKKDLEIRIQKWRDSVQDRIENAGKDSDKHFREFTDTIDKDFGELKGKGEHDENQLTYRKWKASLQNKYEEMMKSAETELDNWAAEAEKRYNHSKSRVNEQDFGDFNKKYQNWRSDMAEFTRAAQKRAHDYYEKCREYIKSKGVEFQKDEAIQKEKKRGEQVLHQQQQKWASGINEIKAGLQKAQQEQDQQNEKQEIAAAM